jgi:mRNA interferase RelE/StbE
VAYEIRFTRPALRQLRKLSRQERTRIEERITHLADDPRPSGSRVLRNTPHYRTRVGNCRVIYRIQDNELIVLIVRVGHRRDVYQGIDDL